METAIFVLKLFYYLIITDLITGVLHFWADRYGNENVPFFGKRFIKFNNDHHENPRQILEKNYFELTYQSWIIAAIIIGILKMTFGFFSIEFTLALAYGAHANLFHQWSHRTRKENGKLITLLQDKRILQSRKHHGWHHGAPYDVNYCILTDHLNPVLHRIRFWETIIAFFGFFGIHPIE